MTGAVEDWDGLCGWIYPYSRETQIRCRYPFGHGDKHSWQDKPPFLGYVVGRLYIDRKENRKYDSRLGRSYIPEKPTMTLVMMAYWYKTEKVTLVVEDQNFDSVILAPSNSQLEAIDANGNTIKVWKDNLSEFHFAENNLYNQMIKSLPEFCRHVHGDCWALKGGFVFYIENILGDDGRVRVTSCSPQYFKDGYRARPKHVLEIFRFSAENKNEEEFTKFFNQNYRRWLYE